MLQLSRDRAQSVANSLATQNVVPGRLPTEGFGSSEPIASNDTLQGSTQNRRVEPAIWANEKLKNAAHEKTGRTPPYLLIK